MWRRWILLNQYLTEVKHGVEAKDSTESVSYRGKAYLFECIVANRINLNTNLDLSMAY